MRRRDVKPCACCGKGVAAAGPTFYALRIGYFVLDPRGIQRTHGLEQHFRGGNAGALLAAVMGDDPELAQPLGDAREVWVCLNCAMEPKPLATLAETP